jgi:hypothetical protein
LADDDVKLVGYFLISVQRDRERVIPDSGDTIIVTDNMTDEAFTNYAVARYLQTRKKPHRNLTREALDALLNAVRRIAADAGDRARLAGYERLLDEERRSEEQAADLSTRDELAVGEERYLRVHFAVIRRWPREPLKFDERQQAVLERLRDTLRDRRDHA